MKRASVVLLGKMAAAAAAASAYAFPRFTFARKTAGLKNLIACNAVGNGARYASASSAFSEGRIAPTEDRKKSEDRLRNLNKSMKSYMKRVIEHETLMKKEIAEYNIGKRHLANMMGKDPATFQQSDINAAIKYLFPSGLFDPKAQPAMKHPDDLYPKCAEAQFDTTGRPHHFLFYTALPNYYQCLYNIAEELETLNAKAANIVQTTQEPLKESKFDTVSTDWLSFEETCKLLDEQLAEHHYNYLIVSLERLIDHPLSSAASETINKHRKDRRSVAELESPLPIQKDENGRPYVVVELCQRKNATAKVTVRGEGTGKILINGQDILCFEEFTHRDQIIFPLLMSDMLTKVDIEATAFGGGPSGQAGAIRWGIAWALRSFVSPETAEKMRIAGLLTRDWRRRERKKFGQAGARKKFTWKKR